MKVWILQSGQDYEGEDIHGVFADRTLARQPFIDLVRADIDSRTSSRADQAAARFDATADVGDGVADFRVGADWFVVAPYDVIEALQPNAELAALVDTQTVNELLAGLHQLPGGLNTSIRDRANQEAQRHARRTYQRTGDTVQALAEAAAAVREVLDAAAAEQATEKAGE